MRTILLVLAGASVALCGATFTASAAPPAAPKLTFKKHEASGWTAELPSDWTLGDKRKYGSRLEIGRHTFVSPSKNLQFSISLREDEGKPMAKLVEAGLKRLEQRMMDVKIVKKEVSAEHYLLIVQGAMLRGEFMVPYFVARIAAKEPKDKTITTMSLSGTAKRLDRFGQIFERLIGSYERRFPKTAPVATAPATPTSKPVKSR